MKTLRNRHGESMIESLITMLIIGMVTAMLTMTVATVLRSYQRAEQTPTFVDGTLNDTGNTSATIAVTSARATVSLCDSGGTPLTDGDTIWSVTVYKQTGKNGMDGGVYYYDYNTTP